MTNRECHDCGKMIAPDRGLRFFAREETADPEEGYLCESCADRRLKEGKQDPFYSESNMKALQESIQQFKDGKTITKTLEELQALEADDLPAEGKK